VLKVKRGEDIQKLSQTDKRIDWIKQFDCEDQDDASRLLDQIRLVNN